MLATLPRMGKKKRKPESDRHKPRRLVGIPESICLILEELGKAREANLTEMVRVGLIDYLERKGKWPPPPRK